LQEITDQTVIEAISQYINNPKTKTDAPHTDRELHRFAKWCGADRVLHQINPSEVGEYSERLGEGGAVPQAAERLQVIRGFLSYMRKSGQLEVNLAQHVRIRKSRTRAHSGGDAAARDIIELTVAGFNALTSELKRLKGERIPLAEDIHKAAADKDVRENAPLEAAREQLGMVESRIRDIELQLKNAVVIDPKKRKNDAVVRVGVKITIKDLVSGKTRGYTVVSASEANPLEGKISNESPVGKAVMRRMAGQQVEVVTPRGKQSFEIIRVTAS
jgi:transcription elongation factor GreA